jgi:signal transduction histidine kinase
MSRTEDLLAAKQEAERASRAKSEFLSRMSHELRTPMNAILGFAQLLNIDAHLNEEQSASVKEILLAGDHLLNLINEVLDLARVESGKVAADICEVSPRELIQDAVLVVRPMADDRGISVSVDIDKGQDCRIMTQSTNLKVILINLLSNAVKYNRDGGRVDVACTRLDDRFIRIDVSDTGSGLSEQDIAGLFEPFNRLGREFSSIEGSGIGLTITRQLVHLLGGRLNVESTVGQGSTFSVEIPARTLE